MQKIMSLVLLLMLSLGTMASAESASVTAAISVEPSTQVTSIQGSIASGEKQQVTVILFNPSGKIEYISQTTSGLHGAYQFSYQLDKKIKGVYEVWIGGTGVAEPYKTTFGYPAQGPHGKLPVLPPQAKGMNGITTAQEKMNVGRER
ncbi:hypothetical protein [Ammoniphilus sp. YIM 78166]|uniref:hypothetical protein n=1 Tax=Ammoniphilus sp. YIM 78166 TaxID=1644106 RepID=UPI00106F87DF|nr:hypothetical protein [Ammoniphilus sp. YIM 78166]